MPHSLSPPGTERFAYVITLWGDDSGFVLGAPVLRQALRRLGAPHDCVLLHTRDVSRRNLEILREVWKLRCVEYVHADEGLFFGGTSGNRFSGVFATLQALS